MNDSNTNVITFGCRLNACESDLIKDFARELGVTDFTLINTCAVTAEAERKLRQTIRRLHGENPNVRIILTGCASELHSDRYIKMDGVVGIISNKAKLSKSEYVKYASDTVRESEPVISRRQKVRGFLQIQNGCDQKCTYCVVRLTRGNSVSFPLDEIANQAKSLLKKGYREIILTGVNISSYGRDIGPGQNLALALRYILKNVPELTRLGLSSLDPADIDDELIDLISSEEKLLPHIHESVQSGDNMILKRMMRRHSREQLLEINEKIFARRPDVVFGADIIVGFPTETDEMFENTKRLLGEARLSLLHIFPFSKRPGTAASSMPNVDGKVILARARELKTMANDVLGKKLSEQVGKNLVVLAEDQTNAKTNAFLAVKSLEKLTAGKEYLFHCESVDKKAIIGRPVKERQ